MNTLIQLWVKPLVRNHEQCDKGEKLYFDVIIEGNRIPDGKIDREHLDGILEGKVMSDIMDEADIASVFDFKSMSARLVEDEPSINIVDSPKEKKIKETLGLIVTGKKELVIKPENIEIDEAGKMQISIPSLKINQTLDFGTIWKHLEENVIGKMAENDRIVLTDHDGNKIFELQGGGFLNVGGIVGADIKITGKDGVIKGGAYIRDDGSLDVGDYERTFYLKIYTNNLLTTSLKLDKSIQEITQTKLIGLK